MLSLSNHHNDYFRAIDIRAGVNKFIRWQTIFYGRRYSYLHSAQEYCMHRSIIHSFFVPVRQHRERNML